MDEAFLWLAHNFTYDTFLLSTKIQGTFWSIADFCFVFAFLKIAGFVRAQSGKRRIVGRYLIFWCSALLNPFLLVLKPGAGHDLLILGICAILVYTGIVDGKGIVKMLESIVLNSHQRESPG